MSLPDLRYACARIDPRQDGSKARLRVRLLPGGAEMPVIRLRGNDQANSPAANGGLGAGCLHEVRIRHEALR
jgi:hypothetical protein